MGRIIGIDYGLARTGIAVTDDLQIISTPLITLPTNNVVFFLKDYCSKENVETIVLGYPVGVDEKADIIIAIQKLFKKLQNIFRDKHILLHNEMYTSKIASHSLRFFKKSIRKDKKTLDRLSAAVILESYLNTQHKRHGNIDSITLQ